MKDYLVREHEVCRRLCVGRATLKAMIVGGEFPPPVRVRPNKAWRSSSVDRYVATLAEAEIDRLRRPRSAVGV